MGFSRAKLEQTLDDIETRLGYLRGNENAWRHLRDIQKWWIDNPPEDGGVLFVLTLEEGYAFPCPNGRFKVEPGKAPWVLHLYIPRDGRIDADAYRKAIQEATDMAWRDGEAWARGVADYCRSVCDQFTKPDVSALVSTVLGLQRDVVQPLVDAPNDDWAKLGGLNMQWNGDAAASFNEFYLNYNDTLARDGIYTSLVNVGFAASAKVISGTQFGAQFFVESILDSLDAQLDQWAEWDSEPPEPADLPPWVADVLKIGKDAFSVAADLVPVVGRVKNKIEDLNDRAGNITTLVKDIEDVSGRDILPKKEKDIPVKTAEEIYTGLTETLYNDYLGDYHKALSQLDQGGAPGDIPDPSELTQASFSGDGVLALMAEDKRQGDWELPDVADTSLRGDDDY